MAIVEKHTGLYMDHYELTMVQGFLQSDRKDTTACFDYFFRKDPFHGGHVIFAGLANLLDTIETTSLKFLVFNRHNVLSFISFLREEIGVIGNLNLNK